MLRGEKVILDADLAILYGVETKALNRAVKRVCGENAVATLAAALLDLSSEDRRRLTDWLLGR